MELMAMWYSPAVMCCYLFSHSWNIPKTDHTQSHKAKLKKYKNTGNISSIFSDQNGMKRSTRNSKIVKKS